MKTFLQEFSREFLKMILAFILVIVLFIAVITNVIWHQSYSAKRFCKNLREGESVESVIQKAEIAGLFFQKEKMQKLIYEKDLFGKPFHLTFATQQSPYFRFAAIAEFKFNQMTHCRTVSFD